MKITKFVHSCVFVEHQGKTVLFDPGIFSWNSGKFKIDSIQSLDAVVVSHKHPDHCGEAFIRALLEKFPAVQWFAPADAHEDLKSWGAQNITNQSAGDVKTGEVNHAPVLPFGIEVHNLVSHWSDLITHPGDTHDLSETRDVLLLPVQAPWGTTIRAIELAKALKPKYILPIHDWMWNEQWRETSYDRFESIFADTDITFLRPTDGETIEIEV